MVPPPRGTVDAQPPSERGRAVSHSGQPGALCVRPTDAVVTHLDTQRVVFDHRGRLGLRRLRVLDDVRQCLGDDEVGARLDLPVAVEVTSSRLPPEIEASAYFIVAEALTNVVKHSQAAKAEVIAVVEHDTLRVEVRDDGVGGADPGGAGLTGVGDRAAALGGRLRVDSRRGGGTVLAAEFPLTA